MRVEPQDRPWSRRPNESEAAHSAFLAYRDAPKRSIELASRQCNKHASILGRWSTKYDWIARSRAWDNHLQAERDRIRARDVAKWERRKNDALDATYQDAQLLREKARLILKHPTVAKTVEIGGQAVTIRPVRFTLATAGGLLKIAAEIESAVLSAVSRPMESYTDGELDAIEDAFYKAIAAEATDDKS
jgi:hypothetical protein